MTDHHLWRSPQWGTLTRSREHVSQASGDHILGGPHQLLALVQERRLVADAWFRSPWGARGEAPKRELISSVRAG